MSWVEERKKMEEWLIVRCWYYNENMERWEKESAYGGIWATSLGAAIDAELAMEDA